MSNTNAQRKPINDPAADRALAESVRLLTTLRPDVLQAVPDLLADLAETNALHVSDGKLRRLALRLRCIARYQRLCTEAGNTPANQREAVKRINASLGARGSKQRCELRAFQRWLVAFREVQPDGLPAGWRGLLAPEGTRRRLRPACEHRGRPELREPASIAFFRSLYVDPRSQSVPACHKLTLAESRRRGWRWPESVEATRRWLRATEAGQRIRDTRRLDGRGRRSERRSTGRRTAIDAL